MPTTQEKIACLLWVKKQLHGHEYYICNWLQHPILPAKFRPAAQYWKDYIHAVMRHGGSYSIALDCWSHEERYGPEERASGMPWPKSHESLDLRHRWIDWLVQCLGEDNP